jgi:hypothetical protein
MTIRASTLDDVIDEVVRFKVKPNAFLYAFEASQFYLMVMLAMSLVLMSVFHFKTGTPISGLTVFIVLTVYGVLFSIFFVGMVFVAHCMEFIATNKRVIVRASLMGRIKDNTSIPIETIKGIEVRSYNSRFGSVYFQCDEASPLNNSQPYDGFRSQISPALGNPAVDRSRRPANVVMSFGWTPRWPWLTSTSGFYGFRHFDTFARLVAELQAAA